MDTKFGASFIMYFGLTLYFIAKSSNLSTSTLTNETGLELPITAFSSLGASSLQGPHHLKFSNN